MVVTCACVDFVWYAVEAESSLADTLLKVELESSAEAEARDEWGVVTGNIVSGSCVLVSSLKVIPITPVSNSVPFVAASVAMPVMVKGIIEVPVRAVVFFIVGLSVSGRLTVVD